MGLPKRDHIAALMGNPAIAARWRDQHGTTPGEAEVDALYRIFIPLNVSVVADYAELVPGAAGVVAQLRARGIKIGSTTGYTREIMAPLLPLAARQGYAPDNLVCAGDLQEGRPGPLMMYRCFADLGVHPPAAVVKVDDTEPGIEEGRNAGTWTVAVAVSGNLVGIDAAAWAKLSDDERSARRGEAAEQILRWRSDYVIDTVADLPPVIDAIEHRLMQGDRPRR